MNCEILAKNQDFRQGVPWEPDEKKGKAGFLYLPGIFNEDAELIEPILRLCQEAVNICSMTVNEKSGYDNRSDNQRMIAVNIDP